MARILFLTIIVAIFVFTSSVYGKTTEYVSSKNGLNLRSKPSIESEIITTLSYGTEVLVVKRKLGEDKDWLKVKVDGQKGYVHGDYTQKEDPFEGMDPLGTWRITAYAYTGMPCANGNYPTEGYTVACNSLDFGTEIYIDGVGFRTVEDRGPGWLGTNWIDLYLGSYSNCIGWGDQYREVWIVRPREDDAK